MTVLALIFNLVCSMCSLDYITNSVCVCVLVTFWGILSICSIIFSYSTGQSSYFSLMLQRQLGLSINCSCKGDGSLLNVTPLSGQMIVIMRSDTGHFFCALVPYELIIILLLESFLKDYSSSSIRGKKQTKGAFVCHSDSDADGYTQLN